MKNIMSNKKGISLIVLVITIVVIIILATAVIVTLNANNPIEQAREATFKSDVALFKADLNLTILTEIAKGQGVRTNVINATGVNVKNYIESFTEKYEKLLEIQKDKLVYVGTNEKEKEWIDEIGIGTGTDVPTPPPVENKATITVTSNNTSMGTTTGTGTYTIGTNATITANPASGYMFVQWNDGNTTNPRQVQVTGNATYTATFAIAPSVESKVKPGDYISYTPTTSSYTSPISLNGASDQTFNPSSYKGEWRVLTNNSGTVEIVSAQSLGNLNLKGKTGYINAVQTLNDICSAYVNTTYATKGRSIGTTSQSIGSVNAGSIVLGNTSTADEYYTNDIASLNAASIRFNTYVRLGSRCVNTFSSGTTFDVRYVQADGATGSYNVCDVYSDGSVREGSSTDGVSAAVTLKSGIKITGGNGSTSDPYILGL